MASRLKHDWNSWENYLTVHEKTLRQYLGMRSHYISGPTDYSVKKWTPESYELNLRGLILRTNAGKSIEIKIEKSVELDTEYARPRARTFSYSYHALYAKPNARNLIRYCSPHGHRPIHHKHVYHLNGTYDVIEVPERTWPHVSEFLDEVLSVF